ncbi:glycoside hydrolase family 88/105 protein [Horticoccus sp. 23ND18S-11]|uniref:glycoside hydrolase family 88/105 protein n=1 Tax=Horticoccus sp. 23ND18S-11 TaxID=3391832 RepID=UPI0039C9459A
MNHRLPLRALLLIASIAATSRAQENDLTVLRRVADTVLTQTTRRLVDRSTAQTFTESTGLAPKPGISIESKFNAWFYQTWLLTDGMRRAASALGDPAYRDYGERNLAFIYAHLDYFQRQHSAGMKAAPVGDGALSPIGFYFRLTDLWHTGLAPLVVERYAQTKDARYEPYLARMAEFLEKSPRLPDGTLHRARGRLMADDPYMTVPYLVRMHRLTGEARYLDDAAQQLLGTSRLLFNPSQGWYRHAWDVKAQAPLGEHWGRANGWMMLTEVELLAALPVSHPARARVLALFVAHAEGLRRAQDPAGGWHQLLDHPESWIESSSTGMFVYGLARGVNEGWLDGALAETARKGWSALKQKVTEDGDIVDVCGSTDVGGVSYYLARPRLQGDLHGFGPFLLSAGEILRLKR